MASSWVRSWSSCGESEVVRKVVRDGEGGIRLEEGMTEDREEMWLLCWRKRRSLISGDWELRQRKGVTLYTRV